MESTISKRASGLFYRACMVMAALLLVAAVGPSIALAHAKLQSSAPADGATVTSGLTQVTLAFSEELSVDQSNAQLASANGSPVTGATSAVDRANRNNMTITTPALADGKYTVAWRAVTEDDNGITNGTFSFTVGSADGGGATTGGTTNSGDNASSGGGSSLPATGSGESMLLTFIGLVLTALLLVTGTLAKRLTKA
ncbi:MAG: copper resistance protein [Chloroflexia bacterium]|jgi:LPXTG-motif cell wall-anchored protein|nr:copper resistance protein [Chloroflexia bacterium]